MTRPLVSDELWAAVAPLLPEEPPKPKGGRPRCDDRRALEGIVFVLWSGIGWERLPREAFGCTGMTCWRRLRDWHAAGVLGALHRVLLERLAEADALDWSRASIDSASFPQKGRSSPATKIGPNPTDRGRPGTKRHLVACARGTPLGFELSGANRHDEPAARLGARRRAGRAPGTRPAAVPAPQAPRRQGLRPPPLPRRVPRPLHHPAHRAARHRTLGPARPAPLGGGAHPGLARPVPAPHDPLRAPG